ncbi:acyltransferase [Rhodobacteraceae bacterium]|nr:acyltransferase [Paracoccaceae bacterium]
MTVDDTAFRTRRISWMPWTATAADIKAPAHRRRCDDLVRHAGAKIDPTAFVADGAVVLCDTLCLGARSWIAAQALLRGDLAFGDDCSVNPYACLSGKITIGNDVRIASHATLVGFDHGTQQTDVPIRSQPLVSQGIDIGDDVWIGANAVVLDGARIGNGAVIAAGAVVRGHIPAMAVAGGVPARVLKMRTNAASPPQIAAPDGALDRLNRTVTAQWPDVLAACRTQQGGYLSCDASGTPRPALRHLCDAIEIAAACDGLDMLPDKPQAIDTLIRAQDPVSGLFPDPDRPPTKGGALRDDPIALYNVLAVEGALRCLGCTPAYRVQAVELDAADLCAWLEALPWHDNAWGAGATVDAIATAAHLNARHSGGARTPEVLFGWLALNVDQATGLWGPATGDQGALLAVNGFYRLTRGSYAQFGRPVPCPKAAIDTVLANYRAYNGFHGATETACNLLDTIHPLWLCLRQCDHRRQEAETIARDLIARVASMWQTGRGIAFANGHPPGLQGTEMWLSVVHTAASVLGQPDAFAFRPRGIHKLAPRPLT